MVNSMWTISSPEDDVLKIIQVDMELQVHQNVASPVLVKCR